MQINRFMDLKDQIIQEYITQGCGFRKLSTVPRTHCILVNTIQLLYVVVKGKIF
jgi:hypothetical protein